MSLREAGAGGRPVFPSFKFQIFCEAGKACLRLSACRARETFTLASSGKLPVASSTPLSQSWRLFCLFVSLDIDKCITWENEKWKYVQRMVIGAAVNAVAFHTTQGKIRLNNSGINNVYVCQSTTSNQKQLHVAQSSPVLCGNSLGMSDKSPLSQAELKKGSLSVHVLLQCSQYSGSSAAKLPGSGASWNPYLGVWHSFALNMLCLCKL